MIPSLVMPMAICIVLLAPATSIVAASRARRPSATWGFVLLTVAALVTVSMVAPFAGAGTRTSNDWRAIAVAHLTLATAAFAFAAIGALCGRVCRDVLDAAAVSGVIALAATFALLLSGEMAAQLPAAAIDAGLVASPLVAIASAANVDILRDDTWYRVSPIAHRSFAYPTWSEAAGSYAAVSLACSAAFIWTTKRSS